MSRPAAASSPLICLLICLLLPGCVSTPSERLFPRWSQPALEAYVRSRVCALHADCRRFPVLLVNRPEAQAELLFDGHLALRRGLIEQIGSTAELDFVLAHEIAHQLRSHRPSRDLARRLPLELEADADAQALNCTLGHPADTGRQLLQRLWPELDPAATADSVAELQISERIRALGPCPELAVDGSGRGAADPWPTLLQDARQRDAGATPPET